MPAENKRQAKRVPPPGDHFVMVQLPSGEERLEPLLDLSAGGLAILLRAPRFEVAPGTRLPRLRLFTAGECTLDCAATVRDVMQVSTAELGVAFKVGLAVDGGEPVQAALSAEQDDDPRVLRDTVGNLVAAKAAGRLLSSRGSDGPAAVLTSVSADGKVLTLQLTGRASGLPKAGESCRFVTELYGSRLGLESVFIGHARGKAQVGAPRRLMVWRQRAESRVRVSHKLSVDFEAPFSRARRARPVVDMSPGGIAFVADPQDGLVVGVLLTGLSLRLPTGLISGRGVVRNVRQDHGRLIAGVELVGLSERHARLLAEFVTAAVHPQIRFAGAADLKRLWTVWAGVGLFARERAATSPQSGRVETTRKVLLGRGKDLLLCAVGEHEEELGGCAELVRLHQSTFTLQHVGTLAAARLSVDQLVIPLAERAAARKDCRFVHGLFGPTPMPPPARGARNEPVSLRRYALMRPGEGMTPETALPADVDEATASDCDWIVQKLRDRLGKQELAALDLGPAQLQLPGVGAQYRALGLSRRRVVRLASAVGGPLGFSLLETASPGVCFGVAGDLGRLFATDKSPQARSAALVSLAHDALKQAKDASRKEPALLVAPEDAPLLEDAGFVSEGELVELVLEKAGAAQLANFVQLLGTTA